MLNINDIIKNFDKHLQGLTDEDIKIQQKLYDSMINEAFTPPDDFELVYSSEDTEDNVEMLKLLKKCL